MRVLWVILGMAASALNVCSAAAQAAMPAGQLVREVVYNELNDHARHGYWRYWVERRSAGATRLEEQVETADGPIARLAETNGQALTGEAERQEETRLEELLRSRDEQARQLKRYDEDEERIGRILRLLPDAFLYAYEGEENGCARLRFRPNPDYPARSIEARVFHGMSGVLWVDVRWKRLARLEGRVSENVDFGYGILGRLYKGGWFRLVRVQVSATDWKTESLEVHMNIRALLVKTFARETSEKRGGFAPVPSGMSLAQGLALLDENRAEAQVPGERGAAGGNAMLAPEAMAMRP